MSRLKAAAVAAFASVAMVAGGARAQRPRVVVVPIAGDNVDAELRQRVTQAVRQGLVDSGVEVAPPTAPAPVTATATDIAAVAGAAMVMRGSVEAEGRNSYTFHLEMVDGKTGATIASREDRCEICTEAEALETANTAASTLKAQAWTRASVSNATGAAATGVAKERARVVVAEAVDLPPDLDDYHGKIRVAIESLIEETGLGLAVPPPGIAAARCTTRDCLTELALSVGATDVLAVAGNRNDDAQGFALALELWNAARDEGAKSQGWCNSCTGPQAVKAAQDLARPLLAHLAAETAATPPATAAGADLTRPTPRRSTARTALSWVGIGAGALAIAAGAFFIAEDGAGTCGRSPREQCPHNYPSRGAGFAIAGAGVVAAAAGLWGLLGLPAETGAATPTPTRIGLGPGWLSLNGAF